MRLRHAICLLAMVAAGPQLHAQVRGHAGKQNDELKSAHAAALTENQKLKKLAPQSDELIEARELIRATVIRKK